MPFSVEVNENLRGILSQPYAFDVVDSNKKKAIEKFGSDFIIDFGIGDPTDPTPEIVRERCKAAVDERKSSGYPASVGHAQFKEAVSSYLKSRFNVSVSENEVVSTYGAKYACFHIPLYFLTPNKGQTALIPNPGYPPYSEGTLLAGGKPHYLNILEENNFEPDFASLEAKTVKDSKILFLNSPHSPTGRVYGREKLKEAVDFCADNNILLVSDECYSELYFDQPPKSILEIKGSEECSIVLNSLSKRSMMTGYAVGFAASKNPGLLKPFESMTRKSVQGIASFIQDAAVTAWNDFGHTEKMRAVYKKRLEALLPGLEQIGCKPIKPQGTFFMWAHVPDGFSPISFSEKLLLEYGINCVPGNLISREFNKVNPGDGFARFALVAPLEKTEEAVKRLREWK